MYQWTCPLAKVLMLWGGGIGTWFAFLFRWISNFCVVKQQQTGQMLSDSQGSLFVCKEISLWGCAGTIELCSGSSCWTSCSAWKAKGFTDVGFFLLSFASERCWPGNRYKFWCNLTGVGPGCSSHRITGWGRNPQQSLVWLRAQVCLWKVSASWFKALPCKHIPMWVNSAGKCVKPCMRSWDWRKSQCCHTAQKGKQGFVYV